MLLGGEGLVGFLVFAVWIYALIDVISTEGFLVRNLPKMGWLFLVLVLPDIGAIAWFIAGRPVGAGWRPGDTAVRRPRRRVVGLEDSDTWSTTSRAIPAAPPPPAPRRFGDALPPPAEAIEVGDPRESAAARERRLMEWEAELRAREDALGERPGDEGPGAG